MPLKISVQLLVRLPRELRAFARLPWERGLAGIGVREGRLNIVVADDKELRRLNRRFRAEDRPTDVLAFDYRDDPTGDLWGDVIVSWERAVEQARERSLSPLEELARLGVHGCLHLLGHDHRTRSEAQRMGALQERVVRSLLRGGRKGQPRAVVQ